MILAGTLTVGGRAYVLDVLDVAQMVRGRGFTLSVFACTGHGRTWSAVEVQDDVRMVLVHQGRFRRRVRGRSTLVDPTSAYLGVPGEEEQFAHPAGGDRCTSLSIAPPLWHELAGEGTRPCRPEVYVDARLDLAHRRVLAAARHGDASFELLEELLGLFAGVLARVAAGRTPADLARCLAVACIEDGAQNLAVLAADLGFADQAHLTRTMRAQLGHTPSAIRRLLRPNL